ncbi:MAG: hypothetical protein HYU49_00650, partial [Candidatus Levybacteria bacterium]|nr:hypothetical protein [Candidatus Levybacteria bacterium]
MAGNCALHDTKTPLIIGTITTGLMIVLGALFIIFYKFGVETLAIAYSIGSILNLLFLFLILDKRVGGFHRREFLFSQGKIFLATIFTGFALYIPIKLL